MVSNRFENYLISFIVVFFRIEDGIFTLAFVYFTCLMRSESSAFQFDNNLGLSS